MLCPEISNFPPPKVITSSKKFENLDKIEEVLKLNNFYRSVTITVPDELQIPSIIEESITEDSDFYFIKQCSLTEFVEPLFIEKFIKSGKFYCLTVNTNCITQNCAAITSDGTLTIHILEYIFQTLGLEGTKRPHNFYEVKIDLKNINKRDKLKDSLSKLGLFDFYITWEPDVIEVCPSSVAKYFHDRGISIDSRVQQIRKVNPTVTEIPSVKDVETDEMTEWIGMLAHECDLYQPETYISNYIQPESDFALKSTRIALLIIKGFLTPSIIINVCRYIDSYVKSRELENYWAAISMQSCENGLWRWNTSNPPMFQAHDSSCNIFFTEDCQIMYSVGQIKYS